MTRRRCRRRRRLRRRGTPDVAGLVVDLSHSNTSVDLVAIRAGGIAAVLLKASQGTTFTDPVFASRAAAAKAAGLLVGAYHFFDPVANPTAQAAYFLGIAMAAGVGVLALDFEPAKAGAGETNAATMCQVIQAQTGRWPLLYTGKWSVAPSNPIFSQCPLWLAEWTTATTPTLPPGFTTWQLWQFESALNTVPGVSGACSRSRVNGTLADLRAWWGNSAPLTTGKARWISNRVLAAGSSAITGAAVAAFLWLALPVHHPTNPPTQAARPFDWSGTTFVFDKNLNPIPVKAR